MKTILVAILILLTTTSYAAQKAITDTGEEVILNSDGTWRYSGNANSADPVIEFNSIKFEKAKGSSFLLKSTKTNSAFWINTNKWTFKKATSNDEAEYEMHLKDGDVYGMTITEGIEIPLKTLTDVALSNAQEMDPGAEMVSREYRYVNGIKVMHMQIDGTYQGIQFPYLGYYYSDESGSTQFIAYTGTGAVDKYRSEIYDFLNGFVTR